MTFEKYLDTIINWWHHFSYLDESLLTPPEMPSDIKPYYELLEEMEFSATEGLNDECKRFCPADQSYVKFLNTKVSTRTEEENREVLNLCLEMFQAVYHDLCPLPKEVMEWYDELQVKQSRTEEEDMELNNLSKRIYEASKNNKSKRIS